MGASIQFYISSQVGFLKATLHLLYFSLVKRKLSDKIEASHCIPYTQEHRASRPFKKVSANTYF